MDNHKKLVMQLELSRNTFVRNLKEAEDTLNDIEKEIPNPSEYEYLIDDLKYVKEAHDLHRNRLIACRKSISLEQHIFDNEINIQVK